MPLLSVADSLSEHGHTCLRYLLTHYWHVVLYPLECKSRSQNSSYISAWPPNSVRWILHVIPNALSSLLKALVSSCEMIFFASFTLQISCVPLSCLDWMLEKPPHVGNHLRLPDCTPGCHVLVKGVSEGNLLWNVQKWPCAVWSSGRVGKILGHPHWDTDCCWPLILFYFSRTFFKL